MSLLPFKNTPNNLFSFAGSVGRFGDNNRDDVIKVQALLANAGYYDLPAPGMPTGWPGGELNRALTRFQKDHGLEPDGTLLPLGPFGVAQNGVGETAQALKLQLFDTLQHHAAPTVAEVDRFYRGRRPGEPEPATDVALRSADGGVRSGEPVGVKPVVMSDEPPADYELKSGQQEARGPGVRPSQPPRLQPVRPPVLPEPPMTPRPEAAPPQHGPFSKPTPGERIPDEWLSERSIIKRLQEPSPYAPKQEAGPKQEDAPQRGRIIIAEDGKELHVPPLGAWADDLSPGDRQIAEALNESLAIEMDGLHTGGSRGNRQTQEGVNMAIQECLKELKAVLPEATITHEFGGNLEGRVSRGVKKEEHLGVYSKDGKPQRKGSNRSDWSILVARNIAEMMRGNTYDSKGGKPADRESNAATGIKEKSPNEEFVMVEKQHPGRTEEEFRRDVRNVCRAAGERIRAKWDREGEFAKPAPKEPAEYEGPENAQRARKIRELRRKQ